MGSTDPPIVVSGGSVSIDFDQSELQGGNGRYNNANKKIKRVEITGDGIDPIDLNVPNGKVTVKIHYSNP